MPQAHLQGLGFALGVLRHCCKRCSIHHKTLAIALSMLAHCNWFSTWAETTGARRWNTVLKHHCRGHLAQPAQWLHTGLPPFTWMKITWGRAKQVPSRPVVGTSGNGFVLWPQVTEAPEGTAQSHSSNSGSRNCFWVVKSVFRIMFGVIRIILE